MSWYKKAQSGLATPTAAPLFVENQRVIVCLPNVNDCADGVVSSVRFSPASDEYEYAITFDQEKRDEINFTDGQYYAESLIKGV